MEPSLNIQLTVSEINAVLQTLGALPTHSGAYPLMVKIKEQAEAQVAPQPDVECEPASQ